MASAFLGISAPAFAVDSFASALRSNNGHFIVDQKGDLRKAIAEFESAIRLDPANADAYHGRSRVHALRGEKAKAASDDARYRALGLKAGLPGKR